MSDVVDDHHTLRIFALLFVNSFLIGAAVGIHQQGLWFPEESNWIKIGGLFFMAAVTVQMIAFMIYKIFFQERLEDQSYLQNMMSQSRRNMKKMNAELQKFQMSLEMEGKRRQMRSTMGQMRERLVVHEDEPEEEPALPSELLVELR
jgi:hypothetical protein